MSRLKGDVINVICECGQKKEGRRRYWFTVVSKVSSLNLQILLIEGIDNDQGYVRTYTQLYEAAMKGY